MDFRLSDDQRLLIDGVRDVLAGECTPDHVRAVWESGAVDRGRWKTLAGLGVVGARVPEAHGGMGLDDLDVVGLLLEAGRAALPEPLLEVGAVAAPLLTDLGGDLADEWLPRIAAGDAVVAPVLADLDPYPAHVVDADLLLVLSGDHLWAVPPSGATVTPQPGIDPARPTATVTIPSDLAPTRTGPEVGTARVRAGQRGAVAAAAMLIGCGHAMIDLAVAYAGQREQFGQPIGAFQAVKHHLADALVDVTFARPLVEQAAHAIALDADDVASSVAAAKAFAGDAATTAARHTLQVHGAIGYTWESDLQLWMKRAWSLAAAWGDTDRQWSHVEAALGLT